MLRFLERDVLGDRVELRSLRDEILVGNFRSERLANNDPRLRVAIFRCYVEARCCGLDQLQACPGTDLAHEVPVAGQAGAATDALAAVLPGKAICRLHDTEGHRLYADPAPIDIEFFGDQHRQRSPYTLTEFGLIAADDNVAIRPNFDKEPQPRVAG